MKDHFYRSAHRGNAFSHNFPFLMLTQPRHLSDLMGLWVYFFHLSSWWPRSMYVFVQSKAGLNENLSLSGVFSTLIDLDSVRISFYLLFFLTVNAYNFNPLRFSPQVCYISLYAIHTNIVYLSQKEKKFTTMTVIQVFIAAMNYSWKLPITFILLF